MVNPGLEASSVNPLPGIDSPREGNVAVPFVAKEMYPPVSVALGEAPLKESVMAVGEATTLPESSTVLTDTMGLNRPPADRFDGCVEKIR